MATRGVSMTVQYLAWDSSANTGKTGDVANHTLRWVKDGVSAAPTNAASEVDATNVPGLYKITLTATETDADIGTLGGKSATANVTIVPVTIQFERLPNAAPGASGGVPTANASNQVDISQTAADRVWASTTRTLTAFSTSLAVSVWDVLESAIATASSIGLKVKTNLDAAVSSRSTFNASTDTVANVTNVATVTGNVNGSVASVTGNVGGNVVGSIGSLGATAKADVNAEVDSALNTAIPTTPTADSINERIKAIDDLVQSGGAGDLAAIKTKTDGLNFTGTDVKATLDGETVTVGTNNDKTGYSLSAAGVDAIMDEPYEGTTTMRQFLRLAAAALWGKLSGAATTTVTVRDEADTKNRITATVDSSGNRTSVTLDKT